MGVENTAINIELVIESASVSAAFDQIIGKAEKFQDAINTGLQKSLNSMTTGVQTNIRLIEDATAGFKKSLDFSAVMAVLDGLNTKIGDIKKTFNLDENNEQIQKFNSYVADVSTKYDQLSNEISTSKETLSAMLGVMGELSLDITNNLENLQETDETYTKIRAMLVKHLDIYKKINSFEKLDNKFHKDDIKISKDGLVIGQKEIAQEKANNALIQDRVDSLQEKNIEHDIENNYVKQEGSLYEMLAVKLQNMRDYITDYATSTKGIIELSRFLYEEIVAADRATEEFTESNYRLYGSQYDLLQQARALSTEIGVTDRTAIEAIKTLSDLSTPIDQIDGLAMSISKANRFLGIGIRELGEFTRMNRQAGGDAKEAERMFQFSSDAMRTFGLTSGEVSKILTGLHKSVIDITLAFGKFSSQGKLNVSAYKEQIMILAGTAKQMGYTTEAAIGLYEANSSAIGQLMLGARLERDIDGIEEYGLAVDAIGIKVREAGITMEAYNDKNIKGAERAKLVRDIELQAASYGLTSEQLLLAMERASKFQNVISATDFEGIARESAKLAGRMADPWDDANNTLTAQLNILNNMLTSAYANALTEFSAGLMPLVRLINTMLVPAFKYGIIPVLQGAALAFKAMTYPVKMAFELLDKLFKVIETNETAKSVVYGIGAALKFLSQGVFGLAGAMIALGAAAKIGLLSFNPIVLLVIAGSSAFYALYKVIKNLLDPMTELGYYGAFIKDFLTWWPGLAFTAASALIILTTVFWNWSKITTQLSAHFKIFGEETSRAFGRLKFGSKDAKDGVDKDGKGILNSLSKTFGGITNIVKSAKDLFVSIVDMIGEPIKKFAQHIAGVATELGKAINNFFKQIDWSSIGKLLLIAAGLTALAYAISFISINMEQIPGIALGLLLLTGAVFLMSKVLSNVAFEAGIAIVVLGGLALTMIALAYALSIAAPALSLIAESFSKASGTQVLYVGTAMAISLGAIAVASASSAVPIALAAGAMVLLSGAFYVTGLALASASEGVTIFGTSLMVLSAGLQALAKVPLLQLGMVALALTGLATSLWWNSGTFKEAGPVFLTLGAGFSIFSDSISRMVDSMDRLNKVNLGGLGSRISTMGIELTRTNDQLKTIDLDVIGQKMVAFGEQLSSDLPKITAPIDAICTAFTKLNEAISELSTNTIESMSKLGPALRDLTNLMSGKTVQSEIIAGAPIATNKVGNDNTKANEDPQKTLLQEVSDSLKQMLQHMTEKDREKIELLTQQLGVMASRQAGMGTEYNSWIT